MGDSKYIIRWHHTSPEGAETIRDAERRVRDEMRRTGCASTAADEMVSVKCDDGRYYYGSQEEADADQTGAEAFAIVSLRATEEPR